MGSFDIFFKNMRVYLKAKKIKEKKLRILSKKTIFYNLADFLDRETIYELHYVRRVFADLIKATIGTKIKYLEEKISRIQKVRKS